MFTDKSRGSVLGEVTLLTSLFVIQFAFFTFIAWHRFVDGDEGFYLLASRLVLEHKRPYLDFFYTQAPLLPYVYGSWMHFAGVTWLSAKLFAALLTALLGSLLAAEVLHVTEKWLAAVVAVVLFATSTLIFAFYPVVKTYSLAALLLFSRLCAGWQNLRFLVVMGGRRGRAVAWPERLDAILSCADFAGVVVVDRSEFETEYAARP